MLCLLFRCKDRLAVASADCQRYQHAHAAKWASTLQPDHDRRCNCVSCTHGDTNSYLRHESSLCIARMYACCAKGPKDHQTSQTEAGSINSGLVNRHQNAQAQPVVLRLRYKQPSGSLTDGSEAAIIPQQRQLDTSAAGRMPNHCLLHRSG